MMGRNRSIQGTGRGKRYGALAHDSLIGKKEVSV